MLSALLRVHCIVCRAECGMDAHGPDGREPERAAWPALPCFLTPGCPGRLHPEPVN